MNQNKKGFTLIELLVVIAIIALLLGIIIPALARVKLGAQTLICSTNLKNYGVALQMYAQDNSDKAPFCRNWLYSTQTLGNGNVDSSCRWHYDKDYPDGSFWPYLKDKNVHMCPTFLRYSKSMGCPHCNAPFDDTVPFNPMYSYSMNVWIGRDWELRNLTSDDHVYGNEISLKLSRVDWPAQCFAFSEENLWPLNSDSNPPYRENYSSVVLNDNILYLSPNSGRSVDNLSTYHNVKKEYKNEGKANLVFVDGHVETMRGLPDQEAYLTYGKPYKGHDRLNPLW